MVFAVPAHLDNGENSEATACFAVNFDINDHGIGLEFADSRRLPDFFKKNRTLSRLLAADRQSACEQRVRDHPFQNYQTEIMAER